MVTRTWRRASTGPFRRCGGRGLGVTQRGSRDAAQAPATNRASPESRSAPPSTLMSLRAACDLCRQAFGFVSLPSEGEGWQDHTSWKSPLAPLTHATVCVRAITVHPCSHLWLGCRVPTLGSWPRLGSSTCCCVSRERSPGEPRRPLRWASRGVSDGADASSACPPARRALRSCRTLPAL